MLKKLMKYDFIRVEKVAGWALLAVLVCAAATRLSNSIYNEKVTMLWLIVDKFVSALTIIVMIGAIFLTFFRTAAAFVRTVFGRQSYFTHTIPAKRGTVYDAKVLCGMAMNLLTLLIVGAGAAIVFLTDDAVEMLKATWKESGGFYVLMGLTVALELLAMVACTYLGIVLGHRSNTKKIFFSVLYTIAVWYGVSAVLVGVEAVFYLANGNIAAFLSADTATLTGPLPEELKLLLGIAACGYTVVIVVLYVIGRKLLVKGVNVD